MAVEGFAEEVADFGEEIEGALGHADFDAGHLGEEIEDEVATVAEGFAHVDDFLALVGVELECCDGGFLCDGAGGGGDLALEFVAGFGDFFGGGDVADAPAGHGVAFGDAVDGDYAVADFGELCEAFAGAYVVDVFVDFVGDDDDVGVACDDVGEGAELLLGVAHAGGVGGAVEEHHLGLGGDGCFELLGCDLEVVLKAGFDEDAFAAGHAGEGFVGDPIGCGDDDFVAGVDEDLADLVEGLFCAGGHNNLVGGEIQVIISLELVADGLTDVGIAGDGGIMGEIVINGLLGCLFDYFGGVEVGFANGEADDVLALLFELAGFGGHGEGFAFGHFLDSS